MSEITASASTLRGCSLQHSRGSFAREHDVAVRWSKAPTRKSKIQAAALSYMAAWGSTTARIALLLVCFSEGTMSSWGAVHFEGMVLEPGVSIKGITVPIGVVDQHAPLLTMSADEVALQSAKVGIFRLSLIPQVVFKNLKLKLHAHKNDTSHWERAMASFIKENGAMGSAAIQGFELISDSDNCFRVTALEGEIITAKDMIKLRGVKMHTKDGLQSLPDASLVLEGPAAGQLIWRSGDESQCTAIIASKP